MFHWFRLLVFGLQPCRKPKTDNQQLLRNKFIIKLKHEVNLRFETQTIVFGFKPEKISNSTNLKLNKTKKAKFLNPKLIQTVTNIVSMNFWEVFNSIKIYYVNLTSECNFQIWFTVINVTNSTNSLLLSRVGTKIA